MPRYINQTQNLTSVKKFEVKLLQHCVLMKTTLNSQDHVHISKDEQKHHESKLWNQDLYLKQFVSR